MTHDTNRSNPFETDLRGMPEAGPGGITQSFVEEVDARHTDNDMVKAVDGSSDHDTDPSTIAIPVQEADAPADEVEVRVLGGAGLTGADLMPPENQPHGGE